MHASKAFINEQQFRVDKQQNKATIRYSKVSKRTCSILVDGCWLFVDSNSGLVVQKIRRKSFADIYRYEHMAIINKQQLRLYLWMAFAYALFWLAHNTASFPEHFFALALNNLWRIVFVLAVNYFFFEYTVPYALRKRQYVLYNVLLGIAALWVHLMLWSFGAHAWRLLGIGLNVYSALAHYPSTRESLQAQMGYSAGSVFFFGVIRHLYRYNKLKQASQQLLIEKQEAELNYLKAQTNPHFLFNTLNNIYSLARDKSDKAPESVLRLSKLLRYMLYETAGQYIAIEQELKIIDDYIALEQLRYDDSLGVNFNHDVEDLRQGIPPLLLLPLVENAFKHGVSETRGRPFVDIHLSVRKRQLHFAVKNSSEAEAEQPVRENIGLSNLRRQLQLLYADYTPAVEQKEAVFTAVLTINLASHV
jgi:two-component system LytT family sensor kinase